ncbi:MAG: methyltransferase [Anaerophaga sp.]|uniref:tRNA1(Val) (adenine(37)-N6)-methyltransferase n=1 Tax=Anaerophaga thermohalophila TaxID=177400 RepID=UPI001FE1EACF|nr:methyltransferase [Anaerophaga thermohalophila]MBZ4676346.1 methyltransferase [Anaerophaga sp.]MDN5291540.1 tRNA1Val (adenine37-N6)-methyltransferase [Anaerophaga sp.]
MKVGTDGVLVGAWTPVPDYPVSTILDVGAGTGLIALMMAQRCPSARIDAVEIDAPSCEDMEVNFSESKWSDRLQVFNTSFQDFCVKTKKRYDLIVCNPPFFSNGLKNPSVRKALARHNHLLQQEELIDGVKKLLSRNGFFSLILPFPDYELFRLAASRKSLFEHCKLCVRPTPAKAVKRVISLWGLNMPEQLGIEELFVESARHKYSDEFVKLTHAFYLNL